MPIASRRGEETPQPIAAGRNQWKAVDFYLWTRSTTTAGLAIVDFVGKTAASLAGKSFRVSPAGSPSYYVWFNLNGGNTDPAIGLNQFEVDISTGDTAAQMAAACALAVTVASNDPQAISHGSQVLFFDFSGFGQAVADNNSGLGFPAVTPLASDAFYNFDVSALSNRQTRAFDGTGSLSGTFGTFHMRADAPEPYLAVANRMFGTKSGSRRIYMRRGQFTPAGSQYYKQVWSHPPASADIASWSSSVTYAVGALVKSSGGIYSSRVAGNLNHTPSFSGFGSNAYWKRVDVSIGGVSGYASTYGLTAWDNYQRFRRFLKPIIVAVDCTPDTPVAIGLPPVGEVWLIADKATDFPIEYPYEVLLASEVALRAIIAAEVPRSALTAFKTVMETSAGIVTAISRFHATDEVSAVARALSVRDARIKSFRQSIATDQ
jgi:hypothetical protein